MALQLTFLHFEHIITKIQGAKSCVEKPNKIGHYTTSKILHSSPYLMVDKKISSKSNPRKIWFLKNEETY
jgi:hypothetical protein